MKARLLFTIAMLLFTTLTNAQDKYFTKTGKIQFISKAPMEDIEAVHKSATAVLDSKTGTLQFAVLMKGFEFAKALMQEHFNENYVESDKFPKAEFKGAVVNNSEINYQKDGKYNAKVKGKLTIHGVTRDVESTGIIHVSNGIVNTSSAFNISLSDFEIKIPSVVKEKLSNNIQINVDCKLEQLKG